MAKNKEREGFCEQNDEPIEENSSGRASFELVVIGQIIAATRLMNDDLENNNKMKAVIEGFALILKERRELNIQDAPNQDTEKHQINPFSWRKMKKKRKMAYYYHLKNKSLMHIYKKLHDMKDIVLPKHLIPKHRPEETQGEYQLKLKYCKERLLHETQLLEIRRKHYEKRFKAIDYEVQQFIEKKFCDQPIQVDAMISRWTYECKTEEIKSEKMWHTEEAQIASKCRKFISSQEKTSENNRHREQNSSEDQQKCDHQNGKKKRLLQLKSKNNNKMVKPNEIKQKLIDEMRELESAYIRESSNMVMAQENNVEFCESKLNNIGEEIDRLETELIKFNLRDQSSYSDTSHNYQLTEDSTAVNNTPVIKQRIKSKIPIPIYKIKSNRARCKLNFGVT